MLKLLFKGYFSGYVKATLCDIIHPFQGIRIKCHPSLYLPLSHSVFLSSPILLRTIHLEHTPFMFNRSLFFPVLLLPRFRHNAVLHRSGALYMEVDIMPVIVAQLYRIRLSVTRAYARSSHRHTQFCGSYGSLLMRTQVDSTMKCETLSFLASPRPTWPAPRASVPFVSTPHSPPQPNIPIRLQGVGTNSASLHAMRLNSAFSSATKYSSTSSVGRPARWPRRAKSDARNAT